MKDKCSIVRAREALRGAQFSPIEVVRSAGSTVIQVGDAVFSGVFEGMGGVEVGLDRGEINDGSSLILCYDGVFLEVVQVKSRIECRSRSDARRVSHARGRGNTRCITRSS